MSRPALDGTLTAHSTVDDAPAVDATRWLREGADVARLTIVVAAGAYLLTGDGAAALKALLVLAPALAARALRICSSLDLAFALALAIEALAPVVRAYEGVPWWDDGSHTVLPVLCGPMVHAVLVHLHVIGPAAGRAVKRAPGRAALATAAGVLVLAVAWELVEAASDALLATDFSQGASDTRSDLLDDAVAATVVGIVTAAWPSGRRRPAAARGPGAGVAWRETGA